MSPPWMPFYVADYLADTGHLGAAEHGAYLLLIMQYWQKGSLPDDDRQLARIARMTDRAWLAAKPLVQTFFVDGWFHPRIEKELATAATKNQKRVAAGKEGGFQKHRRKLASSFASSNATSNSLASSSQPQSETGSFGTHKPKSDPIDDPKVILESVVSPKTAVELVAHRKALKSPLTAGAAKGLAKQLAGYADGAEVAASAMMANGWKGFNPDWMRGQAQPRAGPARLTGAAMLAQMCHEPDYDRDPRPDTRHRTDESTEPADQSASGFAGRLPFEDDPRDRRHKLVDL